MRKLFGDVRMTWPRTVVFAVLAGIYTGLVNQIPFLYDTSFRDIAVCYEWWVLFAVIVAVNCTKPLEAGLKVFVFFLISQPVVYLVETPFIGVGVWRAYRFWFIVTLLTFPGGMLANLVRRKGVLGALILSVALMLCGAEAVTHGLQAYVHFPHHLLSALFCLFLIVLFIVRLIDKRSFRVMAAVLTAVACLATGYVALQTENSYGTSLPYEGSWTCAMASDTGCRTEVEGDAFTYYYRPYMSGDNLLTFRDADGNEAVYRVEREPGSTMVNIIQQ